MIDFGQNLFLFGQNLLYWGKLVVLGQIGDSREIGCILVKLVVDGKNWLYSIKLVVFGQN